MPAETLERLAAQAKALTRATAAANAIAEHQERIVELRRDRDAALVDAYALGGIGVRALAAAAGISGQAAAKILNRPR
ncbi:hypothetical protein LG299_12585 [Microbacterium lacus]|uniref:hypothetical protein n=1 Tax=Microbacterium lacus TaxID=415217 RepID=UPI0038509254